MRPVAPGFETFVYALEGARRCRATFPLGEGAWRTCRRRRVEVEPATRTARLLVVKRRYECTPGLATRRARAGHRDDVPWADTTWPASAAGSSSPSTTRLRLRDVAARLRPGRRPSVTEIHDEEHGLYMTAGGGTYVLDGDEHEVEAGDFIYMPPTARRVRAGREGAEYLLYKDTWRDGF